jgi:hypothetical protein
MRKICVFTQTYSDNREELYIYHNNDVTDIEFRNQFDLNIYSFHNCPDDYTERLKQYDYFKKITNLEFQSNNNIEYTHIIRNVLYDLLKEPSQNDSALLAGANQFSLHMRDMELVHLRHFKQLRNLCNNNQKIKFDALLHQLSKIMLPNSGKDRMPPPGR